MKTCVICGRWRGRYGNNAWPVADGRCCDTCNETTVIPARMKRAVLIDRLVDYVINAGPGRQIEKLHDVYEYYPLDVFQSVAKDVAAQIKP